MDILYYDPKTHERGRPYRFEITKKALNGKENTSVRAVLDGFEFVRLVTCLALLQRNEIVILPHAVTVGPLFKSIDEIEKNMVLITSVLRLQLF